MPDEAPPIEVGEIADSTVEGGGKLRLWRAKEALRQAELRLAAQATALASLEGRAQALVGWAAAALTALVAAFLLPTGPLGLRAAAAGAAVCAIAALILASLALRPGDWTVIGYEPDGVIGSRASAELYDLEAMASGYAEGIRRNSDRLGAGARTLRHALLAAAGAPVTAFLAGVAVSAFAWAAAF